MVTLHASYKARAILLLGLTLLSCGVVQGEFVSRRGLAETLNATVFNVMDYGAKADDKTDNAMPFTRTWVAACKSTTTAKVVIPEGTFLTGPVIFQGPCKSTDPVIVEIQGLLKANTDISEYTSPEWILFEHMDGVIIRGGGTLDGQGSSSWKYNDCHGNPFCEILPTSLKLHRVNNSLVEDITSVNSMAFHMFLTYCDKVEIHNLNITAPANSPNTDGIHISTSHFVNITDTKIGTGDDCISVGQGSTNVTITNVACGPGHGISIGSLGKYPNEQDVGDIIITNCTLTNTTNGARIKTWPGSKPSMAMGIVFQDIIMNDVKNPIIIDQKYGSHKSAPSRVQITDVQFKNIKGTSTSVNPINVMCSELAPCKDVQMADIDLTFTGGAIKKGLSFENACLHANIIFGGKLNPPPCKLL